MIAWSSPFKFESHNEPVQKHNGHLSAPFDYIQLQKAQNGFLDLDYPSDSSIFIYSSVA